MVVQFYFIFLKKKRGYATQIDKQRLQMELTECHGQDTRACVLFVLMETMAHVTHTRLVRMHVLLMH